MPKADTVRDYLADVLAGETDFASLLYDLASIAAEQVDLWNDPERRKRWGAREAKTQERRWDNYARQLTDLADKARDPGITYLYETQSSSPRD